MLRLLEKFATSIFRKDTFTGVFINFSSFIALKYKFSLVYTLLRRCFAIVSDFSKFHFQVETLKEILYENAYSMKFVDISKFLIPCLLEHSC